MDIVRPMNALQLCAWQFSHRCYGWGATSENRAKTDDFAPTRSLWSKISGTRGRPYQSFWHGELGQWIPYNFAADSFHTKKLCSRLCSSEVRFCTEIGRFAFFWPPLGDLWATHDDHLRLVGKRIVDFVLALIELFSLGVTAEALRAIIGSKSAILLQRGPIDPKFQVEGVAPYQPLFFSEN